MSFGMTFEFLSYKQAPCRFFFSRAPVRRDVLPPEAGFRPFSLRLHLNRE